MYCFEVEIQHDANVGDNCAGEGDLMKCKCCLLKNWNYPIGAVNTVASINNGALRVSYQNKLILKNGFCSLIELMALV